MRAFFRSVSFVLVLTIVFALILVLCNFLFLSPDSSHTKNSYTAYDIEQMNIELVNVNTADTDTLSQLPGISEKVAENIVIYREENGDFQSLDEVLNVKGIGQRVYAKIRVFITVE